MALTFVNVTVEVWALTVVTENSLKDELFGKATKFLGPATKSVVSATLTVIVDLIAGAVNPE